MTLRPVWSWPQRSALLYCLKVGLAALLGYLFALGGPEAAVYASMSAALIVGASRGEDVLTSANRVRGTLVGMVVAIALTWITIPPAIAVSVGVGLTAYVCLALGWGVPAARVGAALCAVMILLHLQDALQYSLARVGNTLIGIAAGLAVSYLVMPVRGRDAVARATDASLAAAGDLLSRLAGSRERLPTELHVAMLDRVFDLEKAVRDGRREFGRENDALVHRMRNVGLVCAGALTAAIAHADLCNSPDAMDAAAPLFADATRLAARAKAAASGCALDAKTASGGGVALAGVSSADAITLQGLALGLRKVELGLDAIGR
jgi:uncharacterized membrane protein YccC